MTVTDKKSTFAEVLSTELAELERKMHKRPPVPVYNNSKNPVVLNPLILLVGNYIRRGA